MERAATRSNPQPRQKEVPMTDERRRHERWLRLPLADGTAIEIDLPDHPLFRGEMPNGSRSGMRGAMALSAYLDAIWHWHHAPNADRSQPAFDIPTIAEAHGL